jgi:hypothetical protein
MWKLRIGGVVTSGVLALGLSPAAWAMSGGDANAGDVWVDNVGQAAGPGHEMDPHLACQDINLWGSDLSDSSGTFTIDGWPASGRQEVDYSGTWSSSGGKSSDQAIALISVSKLISQAEANGDSAGDQGLHFKLAFSQDPQKYKTFWINCTPTSSGGGAANGGSTGNGGGTNCAGGGPTSPGGTSTAGGGTTTSNGGTTSGGGAKTPAGTINTPAVTTSSVGAVKTSIGAVEISRAKTHKTHKRRKPVRRKRHHKGRKRHVRAVVVHVPTFTG